MKILKTQYLLFLGLIIACFGCLMSCSGETEENHETKGLQLETGNVTAVETLFDKDEFEDPKMAELLKELNLCKDVEFDSLDYMNPACSPRFYRFFKLTDKTPLENGFMLQIKSKVSGFPLRRLLIFVREGGQLVKANGFVANLIGRRKTNTGYDDLLLRFNDNVDGEITFYNCYYSWNGGRYEFKSVEVIEGASWGGPVKAEFKDSMSAEIKKVITDKGMLF